MDRSLCINYNKQVLDILYKYGIRIDECFILLCLHHGKVALLEDYLRDKTDTQKGVIMQPLVRKLLLHYTPLQDTFVLDAYIPSETGIKAATEIAGVNTQVMPVARENREEIRTELEKLVDAYLELFPKGVRNGGNKPLRSNRTDTRNRMTKFMIKYKYDGETVLKATKNYLDRLKKVYTYCPTAEYFVLKDGYSALATECEMVNNGTANEVIINPFERRM